MPGKRKGLLPPLRIGRSSVGQAAPFIGGPPADEGARVDAADPVMAQFFPACSPAAAGIL